MASGNKWNQHMMLDFGRFWWLDSYWSMLVSATKGGLYCCNPVLSLHNVIYSESKNVIYSFLSCSLIVSFSPRGINGEDMQL